MQIKVFASMTERGLENKVNRFLQDTSITVKDVAYSATLFSYTVLITYEENF